MLSKEISIIIPTYNEAGNIKFLVKRIAKILTRRQINYELIFIDDHSTDDTWKEIRSLPRRYPIRFVLKKGPKGKAYSLLEGFALARFNIVGMIDADLQYPPEAIPLMINKILQGKADVIVANRDESKLSLLRQLISKTFKFLFGKLLHGLTVDVQSGLKVFKKEIVEWITIKPSPWTFDLEFLLKSLEAGYTLDSVEIQFMPRQTGKSKVNLLKTSWEIGWSALKAKFKNPEVIHYPSHLVPPSSHAFNLKGQKYLPYTSLSSQSSAVYVLSAQQKMMALGLLAPTFLLLKINWHLTIILFMSVLTVLYFTDLLFNLFLIIKSFSQGPEIKISEEEVSSLNNQDLPLYTILCPLYQEGQVLNQFVAAINNLNYPKHKLQVLLLLEANDQETLQKVEAYNLPAYFTKVIIPDTYPKTKPKALNYGLALAKGEYTVVYDAEDIPDPQQLKKVVAAFHQTDKQTIAIQAKLNFYNSKQVFLTKLFTAEYSLWFELILTGLQAIQAPIPLGGTSNHFRTASLKQLRGWDAFNVTEDCDLGIRLTEEGYKTAIIDSFTLEEANSNLKNWFNQRTRWIKGYIQTYLVHLRNLSKLEQSNKFYNLLTFQLIIGGKSLSMLTNSLMWLTSLIYFVFRPQVGGFIESLFPAPIFYMGITSMVIGNFLYFYCYMIACAKKQQDELIKYTFIVPFYWLLMSLAAWVAVYRLVTQPHYWFKTQHGLHLAKEGNNHELTNFDFNGASRPAIAGVYETN